MSGVNLLKPKRLTIIPMLIAAGSVIFIFESMIPAPLPWAKLGLSNLVVLLAVYYYGLIESITVSWLRIVIGGLFTGSLFSPAFALGFCGGTLAVLSMWSARKLFGDRFSAVGISIIGAVFHNIGQLSVAHFLLIKHSSIWNFLPIMIMGSLVTGAVVGFVACLILERIRLNAK